jgi:signal peptidase II
LTAPETPPPEAPFLPAPPADGDVLVPREAPPEPITDLPRKPSYVFLGVVALVTLASDLGSKLWAEKALQLANQVPAPKQIIKGLFGFVLAKNKGGAWGLLQGSSENVRKPFFVIVSLLAIVFIVSLYRRLHPAQNALKWGLPLVLGGALGNLVDRIRYGYVIDFIDFQVSWQGAPHHWPTFNVADIAICVGVGLMAVDMLTARRGSPPSDPPAPVEPLPPPESPPAAAEADAPKVL